MDKILAGINILVTRPEHQALKLCKLIEDIGGTAIRFPTIEINPSTNLDATKKMLANIKDYDIGIFISRNAVDWTLKLMADKKDKLNKLCLITIGCSTQKILQARLARNSELTDIVPRSIINRGPDSTSLLNLDILKADKVQDRKIIIFRGQGGDELLTEELTNRGAKVDHAEVYRRDCPQYDKKFIHRIWSLNTPDIIIATSNNGLQNLIGLLNKEQCKLLLGKRLIIMGRRMSAYAMSFGFTHKPIIAEESNDEGIIKAIVKWAKLNMPEKYT